MAATKSIIHLILDLKEIPGTETEIGAAVDEYDEGQKTESSYRVSYLNDLDKKEKKLWDDFVNMIYSKQPSKNDAQPIN